MTELKTLKDIPTWKICDQDNVWREYFSDKDLRQEAIKWIKEDFELVKNPETHKMLERWRERFNIEESELQ